MSRGESTEVGNGTGATEGAASRSRAFRIVRRVALLLTALVVISACASKGMPPAQRLAQREAGQSQDQGQEEDDGGETSNGPDDPDKAKQEITDLYLFVFNGANPEVDGKLARVNKGESVRTAFLAALNANASTFAALTARVDNIEFTSPTTAKITFTLSVGGVPTLEGFEGQAVFKDGQWMLEAAGLCDLVALADASIPCQPPE